MSFAKGLFNLFIAFIVSIYMTIDKFILKNAGKRLVLAIFNENFSYLVLRTLKDCHNIFSGFIIGKSIDSLIIGLLAFVAMTILKLPYTVLISVIIGVTNMIPYFGPIIGAVPGAFILFIVCPTKCLIFIIMENATNSGKLAELTQQKEKTEEALNEKMDRWVYLNDLAEQIANQ